MKQLTLVLVTLVLGVSAMAQDATPAPAPAPAAPVAPAPEVNTAPVPALPNGWTGMAALINDPKPTLQYLGNDMKANTGFKVESTIPYMAFDWKHGVGSAGDIVPFFHEGSYLYTGLSVGKNLNNGTLTIQNVTIGEGVRLNAFTRPFIRWTLDQITFHQLEKSTVLDAIAKGNSTGILAGHNWQGPDQKVFFNQVAGFVGFEITLGTDPNAPSAQAHRRTRDWYLK